MIYFPPYQLGLFWTSRPGRAIGRSRKNSDLISFTA
jgi:hypothetical protein